MLVWTNTSIQYPGLLWLPPLPAAAAPPMPTARLFLLASPAAVHGVLVRATTVHACLCSALALRQRGPKQQTLPSGSRTVLVPTCESGVDCGQCLTPQAMPVGTKPVPASTLTLPALLRRLLVEFQYSQAASITNTPTPACKCRETRSSARYAGYSHALLSPPVASKCLVRCLVCRHPPRPMGKR